MTAVEVLVIGAGPAGMAAAIAAAYSGRSVLVLDDNLEPGGQIWRKSTLNGPSTMHPEGRSARGAVLEQVRASGAELWMGWRVFDAPSRHRVLAISGERVEEFRYQSLILATGARERFLPFPNWTLPGIFGVGGLQALVKGGLPVSGKRVAVAGSGPLLLAAAAYLHLQGAKIICVAEQAPLTNLLPFALSLLIHPGKILEALHYRRILKKVPYRLGCWVSAAHGSSNSGAERLTSITLTNGRKEWTEECDQLACAYHLVPNTELAGLLGCAFAGEFVAADASQRTSIGSVYCAGEPTGIAGLEAALVQGEIAGLACSGRLKDAASLLRKSARARRFARRLEKAFRLRDEVLRLSAPETIVCRCEDVPFARLTPFACWAEAKLQTRCGMGPCQGRVCGPATQAIFGWELGRVRPPLSPVPVSALCRPMLEIPPESKEIE